MKTPIFIQRAGGQFEGWVDTEDGRGRYAWPNVAKIRRWLRLYREYRPVVLDFDSLDELERTFES